MKRLIVMFFAISLICAASGCAVSLVTSSAIPVTRRVLTGWSPERSSRQGGIPVILRRRGGHPR